MLTDIYKIISTEYFKINMINEIWICIRIEYARDFSISTITSDRYKKY